MNIFVIGHGGHSKVVADIIHSNKDYQIIGYLDNRYEGVKLINNDFYGPISAARQLSETFTDIKFVIAIGDNKIRKSIVEKLAFTFEQYVTLIHPLAYISPTAKIGHGTVVMPYAVINADAVIGNHCIINSCSIVEHDSRLEDYVHLCPNSTLAGSVEVHEGVCVGSSTTIIPKKKIGQWTMIGAGATVVDHLPDNCLAVGTPAKVKMNKKVNAG